MMPAWLQSPAPSIAVDIAAHRIAGAVLKPRHGRLAVVAHAWEPLAPGLVSPAANAANIHDGPAVAAALDRVLQRLDASPRRVAVAIPDGAATVAVLRFDHVPARARDLDALLRWQMQKRAPFAMDAAQLTYLPGAGGGHDFVVVAARRDVVREYEAVVETAGAHPGVVDLSTFNVINAVLAEEPPPGDWLLVHATPASVSLAIISGERLAFFRTRPADGAASIVDLIHQTAMYHEDRLGGGGLTRVVWCGSPGSSGHAAEDVTAVCRAVEERLGVPVGVVGPRTVSALVNPVGLDSEQLAALVPLVGLIAREARA